MSSEQWLDIIRNTANYIAILVTLVYSAGSRNPDNIALSPTLPNRRIVARALASLAIYVVANLLIVTQDGSYYLYVAAIFSCGLWFVFRHGNKNRRTDIMLLSTAVSSVIITNGLLSIILSTGSLLGYSILMLAANAVEAAFLVRFLPRASASVPFGYWMTISALPLMLFFILQLQLFISMSGGHESDIVNPWSTLSQLLALVAILGTYYSAYLITTAYLKADEERFMSQRLQLELNHARRSAAIVEQVRKDKHEIQNLFFYFKIMLDSGAYQELRDYVNDKIDSTYSLLEEYESGNKMLDYLLSQKVSEAHGLGIKTAGKSLQGIPHYQSQECRAGQRSPRQPPPKDHETQCSQPWHGPENRTIHRPKEPRYILRECRAWIFHRRCKPATSEIPAT